MLGDRLPPFESIALVLAGFTLLVVVISVGTYLYVGKVLKKPETRPEALRDIDNEKDEQG